MMHFPYGTDPYQSCGYDRIPLWPCEGEVIRIRCMPPEGGPEPRLLFTVDGRETSCDGRKDDRTTPGCILFGIGPFGKGEVVSYRFSTDEEAVYAFTVRAHARFAACEAICRVDGGAAAVCRLDSGRAFGMQIEPETDGFCLRFTGDCPVGGPARDALRLETKGGGTLYLTREPFALRIEAGDGTPLLSMNGGDMRFVLDETGRIVKFSAEVLAKGEGLFGCGEKFDRVNQKGLFPHNIVHEKYTNQGADTYLPTPWLFSEAGWGIFCEADGPTAFDLRRGDQQSTRMVCSAEIGESGFAPVHLLLGSPAGLIYTLQKLTGKPALPPRWTFGPWMSANGWASQKEAEKQLDALAALDIPATAMVLEAWSDEATFYIWNGAKYEPKPGGAFALGDFQFPADGPWPAPAAFVKRLREMGMHLILWQIPVIPCRSTPERMVNPQLALDEAEAIQNGYCVRNRDASPYRIPDLWFTGSLLLDFSNPDAVAWWMEKRRYLTDEMHVEGFKTDGGEFVYDLTARFHSGKSGPEERNLYPARYTQAYYDFLQQNGRSGVLFSRAGYTGSQRRPMHWCGDQLSTFSEVRAQLVAGLSAGLSGIPFWGFDLSGFAGKMPDTELYLRSVAFAAFAPVMQYHSEPRAGQYGDRQDDVVINDRTPWNMAGVCGAPEIIDTYRKYAKLRMRLLPYIYGEAEHCARTGRPLLCHLLVDFPGDRRVLGLEDAYMFGRSLLVAPVLSARACSRTLYLPAGTWIDFWNGQEYAGEQDITVESRPGHIPVFSQDKGLLESTLPGRDDA